MTKFLRYPDLEDRGIFKNHTTLYRWIAEGRFPPGVKLGPNTRAWTEDEIEAWEQALTAECGPKAAETA